MPPANPEFNPSVAVNLPVTKSLQLRRLKVSATGTNYRFEQLSFEQLPTGKAEEIN